MAATMTGTRSLGAATVGSGDSAFVERCKRGDLGAFCELVERYQARVYSFVARSVRDPAEAEDLTQDVFVQAYAAIGAYRSDASFKTWVFRIAHNKVIDHSRRRRQRGRILGPSLDSYEDDEVAPEEHLAGPEADDPASGLCREELGQHVRQAISTLSEKLRVVVVLYDFEDCSYEEIAAIIGCPVGTVKSRLFNARAALRRKLAPYVEGVREGRMLHDV